MSAKEISEKDMNSLRAVLQGTDALAIWGELDRLGLSPMDKVFFCMPRNEVHKHFTHHIAFVTCALVPVLFRSRVDTGCISRSVTCLVACRLEHIAYHFQSRVNW